MTDGFRFEETDGFASMGSEHLGCPAFGPSIAQIYKSKIIHRYEPKALSIIASCGHAIWVHIALSLCFGVKHLSMSDGRLKNMVGHSGPMAAIAQERS